jgi:integrase
MDGRCALRLRRFWQTDWHPHELRHSAASLMLAQGVKIKVVSQVLGHSSIRMTADVYGHLLDPDRKEAAQAMGSLLWMGDES